MTSLRLHGNLNCASLKRNGVCPRRRSAQPQFEFSHEKHVLKLQRLLPRLVHPAPVFGVPEALRGVGAEPVHHGSSVTTAAVPAAAARRRVGREPEPGGRIVGPVLPTVLPEALRRLGCKPVRHGVVGAVAAGMLIMASQSSL